MSSRRKTKLIYAISALFFSLFLNHFYSESPFDESLPKSDVRIQEINKQELIEATLVRVVDGDTIVVNIAHTSAVSGESIDKDKGESTEKYTQENTEEKVRLIGINSPESVDPRRPVECFGKEASNKVKEIIKIGDKIWLEYDISQNERDKYGRILAYVYFNEDSLKLIQLNKFMIENGFAQEYTYEKPYKYQKEFRDAERMAREEKRGLWTEGVCQNKS